MSAERLLFRDFETHSAVDLTRAGAWRYAADSTTEVICVGYAIDAEPVQIWRPGSPIPEVFFVAARDPRWLTVAHNASFEYAVEQRVLGPRDGWPLVPLERQRCTMAMALAAALPGALENVAAALDLPHRKDQAGARLMRQMARPRGLDADTGKPIWIEDAERLERLCQYCTCDVDATRALFKRLPPLSDEEQALWTLDAEINARGFCVDVELARAARKLVRREQAAINAEIAALTGGEITTAGQVAKITEFVRARGHRLTGLTKRSVATVLARGRPDEDVRRLLELRREGARASVRKLDALLASVDDDGRLRGMLRFHGAATGRWSGRGYQPHNLRRAEGGDLTGAIGTVLVGDLDKLRELGSPLDVIGNVMRSMICAAPGHLLIAGDFSTVEARILAWLAGEAWKLDVFRRHDLTGDPALDFYLVAASQALKHSVAPDDEAGRQVGKTCELAFGFGGALGAWRRFDADEHTDREVNGFVQRWRQSHPATVRFWRRLESAAKRAIRAGERGTLGNLAFEFTNGTLRIVLPSGRRICYPQARLVPGKFAGTTQVMFKDNARGGWNDVTAWYGVFVENVVQGTARDLLAAAMLRAERAGFPIVLHVHDELVAEVPVDRADADEFRRLMIEPPGWAAGLPIAAKVRIGERYSKSETKPEPQTEATPMLEAMQAITDIEEKIYADDF